MYKRFGLFSLLILFGLDGSFAFAEQAQSQDYWENAIQFADQIQSLIVRFYPLLLLGALYAIYSSLVALRSALASAKWHIDDFGARRAVMTPLAAVLLILVLLCIGWITSRSDARAAHAIQADQEIMALQFEAAKLSHGDKPRIIELTDRADEMTRARAKAFAQGQTIQADAMQRELVDVLRSSIAVRRGLEQCLPLHRKAAEQLLRLDRVEKVASINRERAALARQHTEIAAMLDRGETDAARVELLKLNSDLTDLAQRLVDSVLVKVAGLEAVNNDLAAQLKRRHAPIDKLIAEPKTNSTVEELRRTGFLPKHEPTRN